MPTYIRLTDYKSSEEKEKGFFKPKNRYEAKQEDFFNIPRYPIAYWVSDKLKTIFKNEQKIREKCITKKGISSGNNEECILYWHEVAYKFIKFFANKIDESYKYYPHNKGGSYRKWYGNNEYIIKYSSSAIDRMKTYKGFRHDGKEYYFNKAATWSDVTSGHPSGRLMDNGFIFDNSGPCAFFIDKSDLLYAISLLNSNFLKNVSLILNPTMHFLPSDFESLPYSDKYSNKNQDNTKQNIDISKEEWDSRETSWDFRINELIRVKSKELRVKSCRIEDAYNAYCNYWREKFFTLHRNEEELNRLFIEIYELQDELTPDVPLEDITILKNEAKIEGDELVFQADEIMKQFISYGVGVMFGRYSLDKEGLQIANLGDETLVSLMTDESEVSFPIDDDNIIPVLEEDYFKDDIASRFVQFVKAAFGEEHLSENLRFIETALGTTLRKYFVKGFYEDHIKRYKKRPIYWMVASPKKGFMSLIYMHRYKPDTFARVRNSYLTEYIAKLEAHQETLHLTVTSETASNKDKKDADKQIKNMEKKLKELIAFDREKMMHFAQNQTEIDLDDGVKVNYCKFKEILYPITGLCKK